MDLKKTREKHNLTQMQLAKLAGMGRYNISLAETGMRDLTKEEKTKIKKALTKRGVARGSN